MDPALAELIAEGSPDDEVSVVLRLADAGRPPAGVRLVACFADIATCRVRRGSIVDLRALDSVASVKAPRRYRASEAVPATADDDSVFAHRPGSFADTDQRRPPGLDVSGRGVIVAHIDWGADFAHPAFRKPDGRTRFLAIFDQGAAYDTRRPNRYGYGRIHHAADIDRALRSADPYAALDYDPRIANPRGGSHGTHTLGISAGNGRGGGPLGLAPEADLAFVELSTHRDHRAAGLGNSASLLEGLDFLARLAADSGRDASRMSPGLGPCSPLVVNASLGRQAGEHDGKTLTEQAMDAFLLEAPGRAIVQSTGNYFDGRIHAEGLLRPGKSHTLRVRVGGGRPASHEVDIWYPGRDHIKLQVRGPSNVAPVVANAKHGVPVMAGASNVGRVYQRLGDPNNGDNQLTLFLDASAPEGEWELQLTGLDIVNGRYHAWVERGPGRGASKALFVDEHETPSSTTGTICNGLRTIAVGAIDGHRVSRPLAHFSSSGPTRDGREKPDLVAPGVKVLSARSRAAASRRGDAGAGSQQLRLSGSSMAAPHVAGTVALMFEAAPRLLGIDETRRLLLASTTPPPATNDPIQRRRLGCGSLDTTAAVAAVRGAIRDPVSSHEPRAHSRSSAASSPLVTPRSHAMQPIHPASQALESLQLDAETGPSETSSEYSAESCHCQPATEAGASAEADASPSSKSGLQASNGDWRASRRSRFMAEPFPFQVQLPLGGGAPALSMPIGGPSSPFAFSLPLGAAPAPAPAVPPAAATATAVPVAALAGTPAAASASPSAAVDAPLALPGDMNFYIAPAEQETEDDGASWLLPSFEPLRQMQASLKEGLVVVETAEAVIAGVGDEAPRTTAQLLGRLLRLDAPSERDADGPFALAGVPSATALFNSFVHGDHSAVRQRLRRSHEGRLRRLAGPGDSVGQLTVQPGDLLIRVALGQGFGHIAVVGSPVVCRHQDLGAFGWRGEGRATLPGHYLQVIELLPRPRRMQDRFARRIADASGSLLPDSLLVRVREQDEAAEQAEDFVAAITEDAATDVRWLQSALNRALGMNLAVDGVAGQQTRGAIRQFQSQHGLAVDGIAGPRTVAALRDAGSGGDSGGAHGLLPTPRSISPTPDCTTLDRFPQGRDDLSSTHQTLLIALARRIHREGFTVVGVTGFASTEGGNLDNLTLGLRRANHVADELRLTLDRMRPGSSAGVAMIVTSRGEEDQVPGGQEANRRVVVCLQVRRRPAPVPVPPRPVEPPPEVSTVTRVFRVVAKSFIAHIGSARGSLDCGIPIGPITIPGASNAALFALAAATDLAFSEDPGSDAIFVAPPPENKGYRLFSQGGVQVECRGREALSVTLRGGLVTDAGKECGPGGLCLQAPPLIVDQAFTTTRIDASRVCFRWGVKGRPPRAAEPVFQAVCARDSVFIWHQIKGMVDCSSGTPQVTSVIIEGSRFPSHRAWLDGARIANVPQGPFSALWSGELGDPTRVR